MDRSVQVGMSAAAIQRVEVPVPSIHTFRSRSVWKALINSMKYSE
jgi:hypothetical protein